LVEGVIKFAKHWKQHLAEALTAVGKFAGWMADLPKKIGAASVPSGPPSTTS
jgi:hypothetical protein